MIINVEIKMKKNEIIQLQAVQNIIKSTAVELPNFVILENGNTIGKCVYQQLIHSQSWNNFVDSAELEGIAGDAVFIPILISPDFRYDSDLCLENANKYFGGGIDGSSSSAEENLHNFLKRERTSKEWNDFWVHQLLCVFNADFQDLKELNNYLLKNNKRVIFIVGGLVSLPALDNIRPDSVKKSILTLFHDVVHELDWMDSRNIGMLIFAPDAVARKAIKINYQQFSDQYAEYRLDTLDNTVL